MTRVSNARAPKTLLNLGLHTRYYNYLIVVRYLYSTQATSNRAFDDLVTTSFDCFLHKSILSVCFTFSQNVCI